MSIFRSRIISQAFTRARDMTNNNAHGPTASGMIAWFTGLSGAGKSTIAGRAEQLLKDRGRKVLTLDGDVVRTRLHPQLTFSIEDIYENNRRFIALCRESIPDYNIILVPKISPFNEQRAIARLELGNAYIEVYIRASLDEVMQRDPKGLYRDAREGRLSGLVGYAPEVPFEEPESPELVLDTGKFSADACANQLVEYLIDREAAG